MRPIRIPPRCFNSRARIQKEEGQSLIEFAFSLGIFLALTLGIIYVCIALFTYEYLDFASREAVRWASVRGTDCSQSSTTMTDCDAGLTEITQYVKGLNYPVINPNNLTVSVTWLKANGTSPQTWTACTSGCNDRGDEVQVTVSYPAFPLDIPFAGNQSINMSSTATMVISQ
jgi:Flp pilus assembly protein TadG